jgi:hypothetical protein
MSAISRQAKPHDNDGHRALVVRQCTALVRYEPRRNSFPMIGAN